MPQVKIVAFEPHHLLTLDLQEEQKYLFNLLTSAQDVLSYGNILNDNATLTDDNTKCAWTGIAEGKVVGCGGIINVQNNAGEAWTLLGKDFRQHAKTLIPEIKRQAEIAKPTRVYALVDEGFSRAERFIKWIGFEYEGTLRKSGTEGQNQKMYARIRGV